MCVCVCVCVCVSVCVCVCVCVLTDLRSKAHVWWTHLGDFKAEVLTQE